jgi:hypothetical protein
MGARIPGGNKPGVVWVICTEFPGSRACPQIEAKPNGVDEQGGNGILNSVIGLLSPGVFTLYVQF